MLGTDETVALLLTAPSVLLEARTVDRMCELSGLAMSFASSGGQTALHLAAQQHRVHAIKMLLKAGSGA